MNQKELKKEELPAIIAIVGCDGSGKSTVSEEIIAFANTYGPTSGVHVGKQAGTVGRNLKQLPLIGCLIERLIFSKARKVKKLHKENKRNPGLVISLVLYAFVIRRVRRFKRMLRLRRQGRIVVTDRYPQLEVLRAIDSTDLSTTESGSPFVLWLARKELRHYEWMTSYRPDLVLRLSVDHATACARKPDHGPISLAKKIKVLPQLKFNGAPIVDIDGTQPLPEVLDQARNAVAGLLAEDRDTVSEVEGADAT